MPAFDAKEKEERGYVKWIEEEAATRRAELRSRNMAEDEIEKLEAKDSVFENTFLNLLNHLTF